MSALPPEPGKPLSRRPSVKGVLQQDVSQGAERVRAWPRSRPSQRGRNSSASVATFTAYSAVMKYLAPGTVAWAHAQVKNSPLLPRDALMMMLSQRLYAFMLPSGRILYPMVARADVSASLDTLGQGVGETLKRGPTGWTAVPAGNGTSLGYFVLLDETISSPVPYLDVLNLEPYTELIAFMSLVTTSASTHRNILVSTDNGTTWLNNSGDYQRITTSGTLSSEADIGLHQNANAGMRTCIARFINQPLPIFPLARATAFEQDQYINTPGQGFNAIRLGCRGSANLTAGRVIVLGR